jgi:hypothetical protein
LGDAFQRDLTFQRDLKPVLSSGLMIPEKFDAMYEMSDLTKWLKQHEANGSCLPLKDEVVVDDKNDQMICVRPQGEASCFWIRGTAIRPDEQASLTAGLIFGRALTGGLEPPRCSWNERA